MISTSCNKGHVYRPFWLQACNSSFTSYQRGEKMEINDYDYDKTMVERTILNSRIQVVFDSLQHVPTLVWCFIF